MSWLHKSWFHERIMKVQHLNSIAIRIAIAIVIAIVLGIILEVALAAGLGYFETRTGPTADGGGTHLIVSSSTVAVLDPRRSAQMLSSKIVTVMRILATVPEAERQAIVAAASEPRMQFALRAAPLADVETSEPAPLQVLRQLIEIQMGTPQPALLASARRWPDENPEQAGVVSSGSAPRTAALIEIELPDRQWLAVTLPDYLGDAATWPRLLLRLSPLFALIGLLSVGTARRLAAPIRNFAVAAERLGVDMRAPPLAEHGPYELRTAIRAFNLMQERLRRFLEDRTQMLAAISHDLRAPLARLRLRAEFVEDEEEQRKIFGDLDAMNAMIDTTLAFARDATRQEPRKLVDLSILVEDVCEDVASSGGTAIYQGPRRIDVTCRLSDIRRAITNLVENAVKYGGSARVDILREAERFVIVIDDDGPGIPWQEQERVFAPFYRLDPSRNPDKGGVGLGLSVARTIAREHGGEVTLANRDGGGLRVRIELPAEVATVSDAAAIRSKSEPGPPYRR
jgi:signal transduction histidine kinase